MHKTQKGCFSDEEDFQKGLFPANGSPTLFGLHGYEQAFCKEKHGLTTILHTSALSDGPHAGQAEAQVLLLNKRNQKPAVSRATKLL